MQCRYIVYKKSEKDERMAENKENVGKIDENQRRLFDEFEKMIADARLPRTMGMFVDEFFHC